MGDQSRPVRQVLDHFECGDEIERLLGEGKRCSRAFDESRIGERIVSPRIRDRVGGDVDARDLLCVLREFGDTVTRAASKVQNAFAR